MTVDDTFWVAGRARGITDRDRIPFIVRQDVLERLVAFRQQVLVSQLANTLSAETLGVDDVDDPGRGFTEYERLGGKSGVLRVDQEYGGFRMVENIGDRFRFEPGVIGVQHRTGHRNREMAFQHLGNVRRENRDRIALADATMPERRCQSTAAKLDFGPGSARIAMDSRNLLGVYPRGAF